MTAREKAEDYFNRIPDGHRNAIQRPAEPSVDRVFRSMVEKANCNGDCIINVGKGVFRPIPGDPVDEARFMSISLKIYIEQEQFSTSGYV